MKKLVIDTDKGTKGKAFEVLILSYLSSEILWKNHSRDAMRPVWAILAGTENQMKVFLANFRDRGKASIKSLENTDNNIVQYRLELLKTAGYQYTKKTIMTGIKNSSNLVVVEIWLPSIMGVMPLNIDDTVINFLCLTPKWWSEEQFNKLYQDTNLVKAVESYVTGSGLSDGSWTTVYPRLYRTNGSHKINAYNALRMLPQAAHFVSYLEKRTRRPILDELPFFLHLFIKALVLGHISLSASHKGWEWAYLDSTKFTNLESYGTHRVGYLPPLAFNIQQEVMDKFLAQELKTYLELKSALGFETITKALPFTLITSIPEVRLPPRVFVPPVTVAPAPIEIIVDIDDTPAQEVWQETDTDKVDDIYAEVERLVQRQLAFNLGDV